MVGIARVFQHFSFKDRDTNESCDSKSKLKCCNLKIQIYRNTKKRNWIFQVKPSLGIFEIQIRILNLNNFTSSHWQY